MGHGLRSAQLAALAVSAYRNARRSRQSLTSCARLIDEAVAAAKGAQRQWMALPRASAQSR